MLITKYTFYVAGHLGCLQILVDVFTSSEAHNPSYYWFSVPIVETINGGHVDCLLFLLEMVSSKCSDEERAVLQSTALFYSVRKKNADCVRAIVENGYAVNVTKDSTGQEPLWYAIAENENTEIVDILLSSKVFVFSYKNFKPALDVAVRKGNVNIIKRILQLGSHVKLEASFWGHLNHSAVKIRNISVLELLLEHLKTRGSVENVDFAPTICTITNFQKESIQILALLQKYDIDLNIPITSGTTAIIESVRNENNTALKFLLSNEKIPLDRMDDLGLTALMHACRSGNDSATNLLLKHGADPNCKAYSGRTALYFVTRGHNRCVEHLLFYKADVNAIDHVGQSPLLECSRQGNTTIMKMLLDKGANINYHSNLKGALYHALDLKHFNMVKLLIRSGIETSRDSYRMYESLICRFLRSIMARKDKELSDYVCALALYAIGADTFKDMKHYLNYVDSMEDPLDPTLKHLCRCVIRKKLLTVQLEKNLLYQVHRLPLPIALQRDLIYNFEPTV